MTTDGAYMQGYVDGLAKVNAISREDYEARLKADMVVMLEEIKGRAKDECWDLDREHGIELSEEVVDLKVIENIIQQKIDKLKGVKE